MAIDRKAFIDNFLSEAKENVESMETCILVLKRDPENKAELATLMRALHTLKGSSRMLKFPVIEKMTHSLENVLKGIREGRFLLSPGIVRLVIVSCDYARRALEAVRAHGDDAIPLDALIETCAQAQEGQPFALEWYDASRAGQAAEASAPAEPPESRAEAAGPEGHGPESEGSASQTIAAAADSIRVKTERIDAILKLHNDLIVNQFLLKKENEKYAEMESLCARLVVADKDEGARLAAQLLSAISASRNGFREQMQVVEECSRDVQRELLSLRMLPVSLVLGLLPAMVEETAHALGKDIRLEMSGTDLCLDRMVLERLQDPVVHIVRNCVDHGIESPARRAESGKDAVGRVTIDCAVESGSFVMRIRDDGQGFDYDRIRRKAVERGLLLPDEAAGSSEQSLNAIIFSSGFSTKDEASELSGRGVGLDIVRDGIEAVKGKISLESARGKGVGFTLTLPLSLATVDGFFVRVAQSRYLVPSAYIKEIFKYEKDSEVMVLNRQSILVRDTLVPVYHLGSIVGPAEGADEKSAHVVVVEYLGDQAGIVVDEVLQRVSLVSKPLPRGLSALKPVQGFVYDENFNMVCILVVPEIMQRFRKTRNLESRRRFSQSRSEYRQILVVDDSFTTREIEKSILSLEGYAVETAVDGIEALEILRSRRFDLVVSDINMPRMDGVTLIENMRRDEKFLAIPVIVVSSEGDAEKRRRLMAAGANSFIMKADFDRGHLAQEARYLLAQADAKGKRGE